MIIIIHKQLIAQCKPHLSDERTHRVSKSLSTLNFALSNTSRYLACIFSQQVNNILRPGSTDK